MGLCVKKPNHVKGCQNTVMQAQLSQDYKVDNRYEQARGASDNTRALKFLEDFVARKRAEQEPQYKLDQATENKFVVQGPGSANYTFRNSFRAKQ